MARLTAAAASLFALLGPVVAAPAAGTFEIIGESGVGAMLTVQVTPNTVFIVDKTENNALQVAGHAAWATAYDLTTNTVRPMDVRTNTFCAAGVVLGNGTIVNAGGNLAVTTDNVAVPADGSQANVYGTLDGRRGLRLLDACDDGKCEWVDKPELQMNSARWYPTMEVLEDGSTIIIGGSLDGGYVNPQDNPTYEYFPSRGADRKMAFLERTYPLNLYPLVWLLPDSRLFVQADYEAINFDHVNNVEQTLPNIPHSFRVYPASSANWLTPLTAENNYTHTVNFCGGVTATKTELVASVWGPPALDALNLTADSSCTSIRPLDQSPTWTDFDPLPEGRVMVSAIILPDLTVLLINGARFGTAGYGAKGSAPWMAAGSSYAESPCLTPIIYDANRPQGQRWSSEGLSASTIPRMYHSTAILLSDGSVFVSGSNPNADYSPPASNKYGTEYRVEKFYPPYFGAARRPQPTRLPDHLSYGGDPFIIELSKDDVSDMKNIKKLMVTFVRPGYSTHAINFSQRAIKLEWTYAPLTNGGVRLYVQQLPTPSIFAPGPALLHVVIDGIPSVGKYIMAGSGKLGAQTVSPLGALPANATTAIDPSQGLPAPTTGGTSNNAAAPDAPDASSNSDDKKSSASSVHCAWLSMSIASLLTLSGLALF